MDDTPSQLTDEKIAFLVQQGDKKQFGVLMERYDKKLSRYGRKFLSDHDNIEDIVQEVFISTYKNINSFDSSLKFSSWIYRIAHNAFINGLKKHKRNSFLHFDLDTLVSHHIHQDSITDAIELKKMMDMIDMSIGHLALKYREVIILHYLEELSYKEISDILQIPLGTVGIRVMRGKEALKKFYEKQNHGK